MPIDSKYLISDEVRELLKDKKATAKKFRLGANYQQVLGFSDDALIGFYDTAYHLMEQQRFEDAADAFFFLTQMGPLVKTFWMGLGHCERLANRIEQAIPAYLMAISTDPGDKECYLECMRGLLMVGKITQSLELLDMGIDYADQHPEEDRARDLRDTCISCKEWIIDNQQGEVKYG